MKMQNRKEGSLNGSPLFCALFAMNHEIIYNNVRKIT